MGDKLNSIYTQRSRYQHAFDATFWDRYTQSIREQGNPWAITDDMLLDILNSEPDNETQPLDAEKLNKLLRTAE